MCPIPVTSGCTDNLASNYDSTATYNDGSCLYPGCLDQLATNYCASCNVSDSSCQYSQCNSIDLYESFESYDLNLLGWTVYSGNQSEVFLTNDTAKTLQDSVSLEFTGGNNWGSTPYTASQAFGYVDHV
mgnify:FL=1